MGSGSSKFNEEKRQLRKAVHLLEEEVRQLKCKREEEGKAYEKCTAMLATKESEWEKERKRFEDEYEALKKKLEEEKGRRLAAEAGDKKVDDGWCLVERMRVEQARREEAVGKWKQLYLAIKTELDDLIRRTGQGDNLCWGTEEEVIDLLQKELRAREEMLEVLRLRLMAVEKEGVRRDREIDILRQSFRILSGTKRVTSMQNVCRKLCS